MRFYTRGKESVRSKFRLDNPDSIGYIVKRNRNPLRGVREMKRELPAHIEYVLYSMNRLGHIIARYKTTYGVNRHAIREGWKLVQDGALYPHWRYKGDRIYVTRAAVGLSEIDNATYKIQVGCTKDEIQDIMRETGQI